MSDLIQAVNNGVIDQKKITESKSSNGNELGKDAFLQLLVTQMKYQDPLKPNTDTEYISQLATFSQLEQMQNIAQVSTNSQALSLVGKDVVVKTESSSGTTSTETGRIDFVTISNGKAQYSVNGKLYSADSLVTVIDDMYKLEQGLPGVDEKVSLSYDANLPKDVSFEVNLGKEDTVADEVAVLINESLVNSKYITLKDNKVTISKDILAQLPNSEYKVTLVFNDPLYTTVENKVSLSVTNSNVVKSPLEEAPDKNETESNESNQGEGTV